MKISFIRFLIEILINLFKGFIFSLFLFQLVITQFEGLLTTLLGYMVIATSLVLLHAVMSLCKFNK